MIKLICYGSKTLYLKEAYRSYAGEKKFTSVQIIAADEIDGHKLSDLKTSLHILLGTKENSKILHFNDDNTAEYLLDSEYTANVGTIGFYLEFTQGESEDNIIGLTNTIYIDIDDNKINKSATTGSTSGNSGSNDTNGKNGVTYTPEVSEDGTLSWTNDGGLPNPTPVNIKGKDGVIGKDGQDGQDGISATHKWEGTILTITSASGTSSADLKGEQGEQGVSGMYIGSDEPRDPDINVWVDPNGIVPSYSLTDTDKREIADIVISDFDNQLLAILGGDD